MLKWTLLTTVGLAGGIVAGLLIGQSLGQFVGAMIVTAVTTLLVGGVLGGMQAVYLRQLAVRPVWWIAATIVGLGVGLAVGVVVIEQVGTLMLGHRPNVAQLTPMWRAISFLVLGLVSGSFLGISQAIVLRRQSPGIRRWVPTTALALAVAFTASSLLVEVVGGIRSPVGLITFVIASGLAFGAFTSRPLLARH